MKIYSQLAPKDYKSEGFIRDYQELIRKTAIPYQYKVLKDEIPGIEKSHVFQNFANAGAVLRGESEGDGFYGMVFQDSDAGKWIEAAAYSLTVHPDSDLESKVDELVDLIASAQDEDGYLDTYFTIKDREKRWTNLLEAHELYCAGHLMEGACAYYEATGKDKFINVMLKNVDHIYNVFVKGGHKGIPGHPEVELALLKMYRLTKEEKCLELAKHFINNRGLDPSYYKNELKNRDWTVWGNNASDNDYQQSGKPLRELSVATGHAVRAVYLYTGMADLASETDDKELLDACKRLWDSITKRQMYVTGGIGSTVIGEAFSVDYDLPSDSAYAETCASIGLMFFASRMLENELNSEYADVMERAFYNTVLAGMQLDGQRFFYVNPLEIVPGISGVANTKRHDLTTRPGWYACACCPPNVARLISSFGKYAYGENDKAVYCNLFAAGTLKCNNGMVINCQTNYPYDYTVTYKIEEGDGSLFIRIPGWSRENVLKKNGQDLATTSSNGYVEVPVSKGDVVELSMDGRPYFIYPSTKIPAISGMRALAKGPLVYCFEGKDNEEDVLGLVLQGDLVETCSETINGVTALKTGAVRNICEEGLYSMSKPVAKEVEAIAVPYYTWGNRGENQMRVFMPYR